MAARSKIAFRFLSIRAEAEGDFAIWVIAGLSVASMLTVLGIVALWRV